MSAAEVLIIGAGPTGLVLALRLAHHGIRLRIVDRAAGPGEASRAIVVQARTLEFYQQLGIADEAIARGTKMTAVELRSGSGTVARLRLDDIGAEFSPYPFALCFPQDDHERFLVEKLAATGNTVEWKTEMTGFTQSESGVRAMLAKDGIESVAEADYLCGCDGVHSRVRHGLGLDFSGGTYKQRFFVADVETGGSFVTDLIGALGAHELALMFPVRSSGTQRLIGVVPPHFADAPVEFDDVRPRVEALLGIRVERINWFSAYHVHHRVAARFAVGRAFLLGDAGHVHSPAGGQGMNTGIGDAVNLAWKLADVLRGRAGAGFLDTYESERIGFARVLVATTDRAFRTLVDPGLAGRFLRTSIMPRVLPRLTSFAAVRRAMFMAISQTRIAYPGSALSAGRAGGVRGGDRLPWIATGTGWNFDALTAAAWRVHIYGVPAPALVQAAAGLGLPVDAFAWSAAASRAGLRRDAMYLVRPDGHVALASAVQDAAVLRDFVAARQLDFRTWRGFASGGITRDRAISATR